MTGFLINVTKAGEVKYGNLVQIEKGIEMVRSSSGLSDIRIVTMKDQERKL